MIEPLLEISLMVHPPLVGRMGYKPRFEDDKIASLCYSNGTICPYLMSGLSQIERKPMNEKDTLMVIRKAQPQKNQMVMLQDICERNDSEKYKNCNHWRRPKLLGPWIPCGSKLTIQLALVELCVAILWREVIVSS